MVQRLDAVYLFIFYLSRGENETWKTKESNFEKRAKLSCWELRYKRQRAQPFVKMLYTHIHEKIRTGGKEINRKKKRNGVPQNDLTSILDPNEVWTLREFTHVYRIELSP